MRKLVRPCLYIIGGIALVLYGPSVLVFVTWLFILGSATPPSDAEMLANFHENRQAFETVAALVKDTPIDISIASRNDRPLDSLDIVSRTLVQAHVTGVSQSAYGADMEPGLRFDYWAFGLTGGTTKFYVYGYPHPPTPVVSDLDAFPANAPLERHWRAYRHIEGLWYLGMDHEP